MNYSGLCNHNEEIVTTKERFESSATCFHMSNDFQNTGSFSVLINFKLADLYHFIVCPHVLISYCVAPGPHVLILSTSSDKT